MMISQKFRILTDKFFFVFIFFFSALALIPFFILMYNLVEKGFKQISTDFITQLPPTPTDAILANAGNEILPGGVVNGICGSFFLILIAILLAVPLGILAGAYIHERKGTFLAWLIHYSMAILNGIPSIVIGICVYIIIVRPTRHFSALAGGISLAITMLPMIVRMSSETLRILPTHLKESGFALGGSYSSIMLKIVMPTVRNGLLTGSLIAISRTIGKTSPLLLTAFGSSMVNWDIQAPTSSLSLLIWKFLNIPSMADTMWSVALFLLCIVFSLNIIAKRIGRQWKLILRHE